MESKNVRDQRGGTAVFWSPEAPPSWFDERYRGLVLNVVGKVRGSGVAVNALDGRAAQAEVAAGDGFLLRMAYIFTAELALIVRPRSF
jgi:hypothetical protein